MQLLMWYLSFKMGTHKNKLPERCEQCGSTAPMTLEYVTLMTRDSEELAWTCADCQHAHISHDDEDCEGC